MKALSALFLSALLGAATASAAEHQGESPRDKALMLYFSKSFGGKSDTRTPLAFGLRLQQSSPYDASRAVALVDARYWLGGPRILAFAGVPALSLGGEDEDDGNASSGEDVSGAIRGFGQNHPGWTVVMIVGAVLGGACLLEWGICEEDKKEPTTDTSNTTTDPR